MAAEKITAIDWTADRLHTLQPVIEANPYGPLATAHDVFFGAHLFEFEHGRQHALIAVRPVDYSQGRRLDIVGLRSDGERLDAAALNRAVMGVAMQFGADLMAMSTQLPHVVRSCARHGWMTTGAVMLKVVKIHG